MLAAMVGKQTSVMIENPLASDPCINTIHGQKKGRIVPL